MWRKDWTRVSVQVPAPGKAQLKRGFVRDATTVAYRMKAFAYRWSLLLLVVAAFLVLFVGPVVLFGIGSTEPS